MPQIDPKALAELKSTEARAFQTLYASDKVWDVFKRNYLAYKSLLAIRKPLQALARRCEEQPERFCEVLMPKSWFTVPSELSSHQVRQATALLADINEFTASPMEISDLDGKQIFKRLQALGARRPGRKRAGIFLQARALQQADPRLSIHSICQQLSPEYSKMTSHQRRAERERMRSGISRLKDIPPSS